MVTTLVCLVVISMIWLIIVSIALNKTIRQNDKILTRDLEIYDKLICLKREIKYIYKETNIIPYELKNDLDMSLGEGKYICERKED